MVTGLQEWKNHHHQDNKKEKIPEPFHINLVYIAKWLILLCGKPPAKS
jgi:hypothetical protein